MRWDQQGIAIDDPQALPGLGRIAGLLRTVTTPDFAGVRFHEVAAKSALNKVPAQSSMPFTWTINPYRGCTHACVYCYARGSHTWLELDTGRGFDTEIVVKVNVAEVLRRELARPSWTHESVALGTNTDPYQRAEGRYGLMPGIISALAASGTPMSILTKGTLLRRDLPLLRAAAQDVSVGLALSIAIVDESLQPTLEAGTPSVRARLDLVRALTDAGLPCGVFVAPVLPYLTDTDEHLDRLLGEIAAAGATGCTVLALHLRPGAREWFFAWLRRERPALVPAYEQIYGRGAYVGADYRRSLARRVRPILERHGLIRRSGADQRRISGISDAAAIEGDFPDGALPALAEGRSARGSHDEAEQLALA
ncbi:MAG: Rv2578c family radical SAM protein [Actinomycetota bacterium]|nr:Rv2578c family radical SAM protein [Actinomycetota bacterium]